VDPAEQLSHLSAEGFSGLGRLAEKHRHTGWTGGFGGIPGY
jgi:hypothetical protein